MTGSLQVKNDKYYAVINMRDVNGKRSQRWYATGLDAHGNKRRADQFLRAKLKELEASGGCVTSDVRFSDAVRQWLKDSAIRVDEVTLQGYTALADRHILPYFDQLGIKLVDVDRRVLQRYVDVKYSAGRIDGKGGLSARSIRLHKNILYQTLNSAVRDNILPSNPCQFVTLPQMKRYEAHYYNEEQINALLEAVKDEPLYPVIKLAAVYGLRRSEVLGLKWDSIDFNNGTVTIKHTVTKVTTAVEKDKTKNQSSHRSFPLMPDIRQMLLDMRAEEQDNRRLFGKEYHGNDYILKWPDGTPFSTDFVSQRFSRLLEINGMPHIRFHELRHSCASFLINNGFSLKDVQEWMGHSDIKVTADIYSHLDVSRKYKMADMLSDRLDIPR